MSGYARLIHRCMCCLRFVSLDGVITMRVDFESQMFVSKPIENPGILQNVRHVAHIITITIFCCFLIYFFVFQDVTLQSLFLLLRYGILLSDVVLICLCSVMQPFNGLIDSPANIFLVHSVVFVQQVSLDLFLSFSGVYTDM